MKFTSPSGREYNWDKPNPPTQDEIDALVEYDKSLGPAKDVKSGLGDLAGDIALDVGYSMGGQLLGAETGPGYFVIAPAAGAYGNYLKQQRQIERGDRKDLSYSEMVSSALINLIPASAMFKTGATAAQTIGRQAAFGAVTAATPEATNIAMGENRFPTLDDYYSMLKRGTEGAVIGGAAGSGLEMAKRLTPLAKELWGKMLAGKTQSEVNQTLSSIAQNGNAAERKAAAEIIDTVGTDLGLVRPVAKSAEESAQTLRAAGSAKEAAQTIVGEEAIKSGEARDVLVSKTAEAAKKAIAEARATPRAVLSPAEEAAQTLGAAGTAKESASALLGQQVVEGEVASQRALQEAEAARRELIKRTASEAATRVQVAEPIPLKQLLWMDAVGPAEIAAERLASVGTAKESAQAFQQAMEGKMSGPLAQSLRVRAERERQFAQARAEEAQQAIRGSQLAGEESVVFAGSPERTQLNILETRPGSAAREKERLRQRMGIQEEVLPTTEDVLNEFSALRGVGSKQQARRMGMEGGKISAGVMAAAGIGAAGVGTAAALAAPSKTIIVETPAGELRYDSSKYSMEDIQKDVSQKMLELEKIKAADEHLKNRSDYENAPNDESRIQSLLSWSNAKRAAGIATRTAIQAAGSRLPMAARPAPAIIAEYLGAGIEGRLATPGEVVRAGIESLPRGSTSVPSNILKFGSASVAGEAAKEAVDTGKLLDFNNAVNYFAKGGAQALVSGAVESGMRAKSESQRQRRDLGEIEMFQDGKRLGIVLDPAAVTNPDKSKIALVKLSGGTNRFQQDAARVNTPVVMDKVRELAGSTGNPKMDQQLSPDFFAARRLQEGKTYQNVARVPGMGTLVDDWKQANSTARNEYKKYATSNKIENLNAARDANKEADRIHSEIESRLNRAGLGSMVNDLDKARQKISELYTLEAAVGPTNKITDAKVWGQMYSDDPKRYTGDLKAMMRIAAAQPGVLQDASAIPIKGLTKEDMSRLPFLRSFMTSKIGQNVINPRNYGADESTMAAQLARFGAQNTLQSMYRPVPYQ